VSADSYLDLAAYRDLVTRIMTERLRELEAHPGDTWDSDSLAAASLRLLYFVADPNDRERGEPDLEDLLRTLGRLWDLAQLDGLSGAKAGAR
jgi:hypothetical protein